MPELVETSTWPVEVTSPETSCVERFSWNSLIAPCDTLKMVVPTVSSVMSCPSRRMRVVRPETPPTEMAEYPALVGSNDSPLCRMTPGSIWAKIEEVAAIYRQVLDLLRW